MSTATASVGSRVEAAERLANAVVSGGWVAPALRNGGTAAPGGVRPVQRLVEAGLGDFVSLVEPLQHAVDRMVVDGSVQAFTDALTRAASVVEQVGREFVRSAVAGEADWTGAAGDRYRARAGVIGQALAGVARVLAAGGAAARMTSAAVGSARAQADALLDHCVGQLISYVQLARSVQGGDTVEIRAEAASLVASYARPVADLEEMLRQTARQLAGTGQAGEVLAPLRESLTLPPSPRPTGGSGAGGDPNLILAGYSAGGDSGTTTASSVQSATGETTTRGLATGGEQGTTKNVQLAAGWTNRWRPTAKPGWKPGGRPTTPKPGSIGRPVGSPQSRQPVIGRKTHPFDTKQLLPTPRNDPKWNRANPKDREKIQEAAEEIHNQLLETFLDVTNGMRDEVAHDLPNIRKDYPQDWTNERVIGTETDKRIGKWVADNHDKLIDPGSGWQLRGQVAQMSPEAEVPWGTDGSRRVDIVLQREIPNPKWDPASNALPQFGHENVTVYDVKTGEKGIEADWAKDVKRKFDPLFEPVEIHPDRGTVESSTLRGMRLR
ncbi:WXG100 family type VII secretion target [Lentzea sp. NPDC055074]